MKYFIVLAYLLSHTAVHGQDLMVDCRDQQEYPIADINGTLWMAANLRYETSLSSRITKEQKEKQSDLVGRYYHVNEINSICPCDWRLPDADDWINYFDFLAANKSQVKLAVDKSHISFHEYDGSINIFSEDSPINLIPTGRLEGGTFYLPDNYADFWTDDPPRFGELDSDSRLGIAHILTEVYDGKTHIHLRQTGISNIHSHKHHLDPDKEKKLRKFMVRCVKSLN